MGKEYRLVRRCNQTSTPQKEKEDTVTELSEEELNALIDAKVEERLKEASEKKDRNHDDYVSERQWWAIEKVAAYLEHSRLNEYVARLKSQAIGCESILLAALPEVLGWPSVFPYWEPVFFWSYRKLLCGICRASATLLPRFSTLWNAVGL